MPELDLSNASALRIANQNVLAVRIANQDIWTAPAFKDYSVFGEAAPTVTYTNEYFDGDNLGIGGWTANNFYSYGSAYQGATVAGARIWIPAGSVAIGESAKISLYQTPVEDGVTWEGYTAGDVTDLLLASAALTEFPAGTLVEGWNNLYFSTDWPLNHYAYISVGISIGDGSKYVFAESPGGAAFISRMPIRLALTETMPNQFRGVYRDGNGESDWRAAHYGIDVILRLPDITFANGVSFWDDSSPTSSPYSTYNGLGAGSWTGSHYYSYSAEGPQGEWELTGARIWVPLAENDPIGLQGVTAQAGYFIKQSGLISRDADSPEAIINGFIATATPPMLLSQGWNTVYFPAPIPLDWGAGIAIGWQIAGGDSYVSGRPIDATIPSINNIPFWLGASDTTSESRGVYSENGSAFWSFQNNHYGGDPIVKRIS